MTSWQQHVRLIVGLGQMLIGDRDEAVEWARRMAADETVSDGDRAAHAEAADRMAAGWGAPIQVGPYTWTMA